MYVVYGKCFRQLHSACSVWVSALHYENLLIVYSRSRMWGSRKKVQKIKALLILSFMALYAHVWHPCYFYIVVVLLSVHCSVSDWSSGKKSNETDCDENGTKLAFGSRTVPLPFGWLSLVPRRSLLICSPRKVWERADEYLSVTSQLMVESRNDRAENAWELGWGWL